MAQAVLLLASSAISAICNNSPHAPGCYHAGPDRALFLPGGLLDAADVPAYLNGSLAGDYGYDPLGLGKDTETVEKYRAYELLHARWAMLAAAGIIIPEGLQVRAAHIVPHQSSVIHVAWPAVTLTCAAACAASYTRHAISC